MGAPASPADLGRGLGVTTFSFQIENTETQKDLGGPLAAASIRIGSGYYVPGFLFWFYKRLGPSPLVQAVQELFPPEHLWAGDVLVTAEVAMKCRRSQRSPLYLGHHIPLPQ